jgi:hypothetical protein
MSRFYVRQTENGKVEFVTPPSATLREWPDRLFFFFFSLNFSLIFHPIPSPIRRQP